MMISQIMFWNSFIEIQYKTHKTYYYKQCIQKVVGLEKIRKQRCIDKNQFMK